MVKDKKRNLLYNGFVTFFDSCWIVSSALAFLGRALSIKGIGITSSETSCLAAIIIVFQSPSNVFDLLFDVDSLMISIPQIKNEFQRNNDDNNDNNDGNNDDYGIPSNLFSMRWKTT